MSVGYGRSTTTTADALWTMNAKTTNNHSGEASVTPMMIAVQARRAEMPSEKKAEEERNRNRQEYKRHATTRGAVEFQRESRP